MVALPILLGAGLSAQDAEKAPKAAKLRKALSTMTRLPSLAFETSTTTTAQNPFVRLRGGRAPKPRTVATNGVSSGDILSLSFNDDEDQVIFRGRRMIARNDDSAWALRRGKLAEGGTLPFVFDPELFFGTLSKLPLKVMHKEVGTANNKPVETYTISISGEDAQNLLWGGVIPEPSASGSAGAMQVVMIGGAGGGFRRAAPKVKMTVDLAISIDPATSLVHKIKVRTYSKANNNRFGGMVIRAGGGGFGEDEDDEDEEDEEEEAQEFDPENPKFEGALPVRKKKGKNVMKFNITITEHNSAVLDLNARARSLLNLPR
jgi:hypothetical protein